MKKYHIYTVNKNEKHLTKTFSFYAMDLKNEPKIIKKVDVLVHDRDKKRQGKKSKIIESKFGRFRAIQHVRAPISKYG